MARASIQSARALVIALWLVVVWPLPSGAQQPSATASGTPDGAPAQTPPVPGTADQQPSLSVVGIHWQRALAAAPAVEPAFDLTHAYVALRDGMLVAVSVESGAIDWSMAQQATVGLEAAARHVLGVSDRELWARDGATGEPQWQVTLSAKAVVGPRVVADTVIVATDTGELVAVALSDGTPRWHVQLDRTASTPLAAGGGRVFVGTPDGHVVALSAATGDRVWTRSLRGRITALTGFDTTVLAGSDSNYLYVLASGNGRIAWKWRTGGDIIGPACADARHYYYVSMDTVLRAHNRKNGHLAWQIGLATRPTAGPALFGETVAVGGVTPQVSIYAAADGTAAPVVTIPSGLTHRPHVVPAAGAFLDRLVLVTRLGDILAIGRSPDPALIPLAEPPGTTLAVETLVPPLEQPLVSLSELLGARYGVVTATPDAEPPLVPLDVLLGRQMPPFTVPPGVEPPLVPLGELPGRRLAPETLPKSVT